MGERKIADVGSVLSSAGLGMEKDEENRARSTVMKSKNKGVFQTTYERKTPFQDIWVTTATCIGTSWEQTRLVFPLPGSWQG